MKVQLNETQYRAFLNFKKAYEELRNAGVAIVRDNYTDALMFISGTEIDTFLSPSDIDLYPESVDISHETYYTDNYMAAIIDAAYYSCDGDRIHILTKEK